MLLFKRYAFLWALLLLALLAIGSIHCGESSESSEASPSQTEEFDENYQDYEDQQGVDESENGSEWGGSGEYNPNQQQQYQEGYAGPPPPMLPPRPYPAIYGPDYIPHMPIYGGYGPYPKQPYLPAPRPLIPYQPPVEISYQQKYEYAAPPPPPPTPVYQPQPAYQAPPPPPPPQPVYQAPPVEISYQQKNEYVAPLPAPIVPAPVYQQPAQTYQQPLKQQYVSNNYSTPSYQQPEIVYKVQQPIYAPPPPPKVLPLYKQSGYQNQVLSPNYTVTPSLQNKYSLIDLAPFIAPFGYRANHWSLFYYRTMNYRQCPKNLYLSGPSYNDIVAAFQYAQQQLGLFRDAGIQYMNSTQPSFAARHQIFHVLGQQNARLDEEGLLVELVSTYLADRACLTKWDRQRYLPQLTKLISASNFPYSHSCSQIYQNKWQGSLQYCVNSKYRTYDGFCNNPYHPYWGKSNVCHIRLLSPDYADGISLPRTSANYKFPLPNPRYISNAIHFELPIDGPYNMMKMQWGQFINHDITNTALSTYDGLVDCCKNPNLRGCWPIWVPPGDKFYSAYNVSCLNFIRSGACPICQLGPRQQLNKNTAFLDLSHVYGNTPEVARTLRTFHGGLLRSSLGKGGEILLPSATNQDQCAGSCFLAGDSRVNQHPALTVLHTLLLRNHNAHARALAVRHPNWNDETLFQEARRINIAEYQMINYNEYFPIVFGPILSAYYKLYPQRSGYTYYEPKADPTTWNEYSTAACRFGHSQIQSTFGLYAHIAMQTQHDVQPTFRLKEWFMRPTLLSEGLTIPITNALLARPAGVVDPWISNDARNHLYQSHKEHTGGDLAATNIWRGRDHGIPGYVHYVEYCFNVKVRGWKDLQMFIPYHALNSLRRLYKVVENIDLFTGGLAERHFPGADIGPTFACINGIQYYHLKFGDRYYFEHGGQAGSFNPIQLEEIRRATLARLLCRTAYLPVVPQYAFLAPSIYNPLVNCSLTGEFDYSRF